MAIDLARAEISRMAKLLGRMQRAIIVPFLSQEPRRDDFFPQLSLIEGIKMREARINILETFLAKFEQQQNPLKGKNTRAATAATVEQSTQQALPAVMRDVGVKPQAKGSPIF